jgi:hypothetical protein
MKRFDSTITKCTHLFQTTIILTNLLHLKFMDFTYDVIGEHNLDIVGEGWVGGF